MAHTGCSYHKDFTRGKPNTAINDHIHNKHGVGRGVAGRGAGEHANQEKNKRQKKSASLLGKARSMFLAVVYYLIDCLLPHTTVGKASFRAVSHPDWTPCGARKARAGIGEMFLWSVGKIRQKVKAIKASCPALPMFHINLDLWTSKISNDKFMGVRIFAVESPGGAPISPRLPVVCMWGLCRQPHASAIDSMPSRPPRALTLFSLQRACTSSPR